MKEKSNAPRVMAVWPFIKVEVLSAHKEDVMGEDDGIDWEKMGVKKPQSEESNIELKDCFYVTQFLDRYDIKRIVCVDENMCTILTHDGDQITIRGNETELLQAIIDFEEEEMSIEVEKQIEINRGSAKENYEES